MERIIEIFKTTPHIKLAYLFGSRARKDSGPTSDFDFALYLDEKMSEKEMFELKLSIQAKISQAIGTNEVDIAILNQVESPELRYSIIKDGKLVYEQESYRVIVEPRIYDEYFDFKELLKRFGLTQA